VASLESLRHVSIGRYVPVDSPVHRLDPRIKVGGFGVIVLLVAVVGQLGGLALLLVGSLALVLLAGLDLRDIWRGLRPALPIILVLLVLQLVYTPTQPGDRVLLEWGKLRLGWPAVRLALVSLLRFAALMLAVALLMGATTVGALTRGVEGLLRPLTRLGLPAHELALVGAVALRFLPLLGEQLESIAMAQASRGLAESQGRWQMVANARRTAQLIVPLFVDVYRRSEELALAMQARCYNGGKGRTHLLIDRFARRDWVALLVLTMWGGAAVALRWLQ
jgi:energy-coupling factor transport system permease protein